MLLGADLIVLPTNWPTGHADRAVIWCQPGPWRTTSYYAAVNRVGEERGFRFIGQSRIVAVATAKCWHRRRVRRGDHHRRDRSRRSTKQAPGQDSWQVRTGSRAASPAGTVWAVVRGETDVIRLDRACWLNSAITSSTIRNLSSSETPYRVPLRPLPCPSGCATPRRSPNGRARGRSLGVAAAHEQSVGLVADSRRRPRAVTDLGHAVGPASSSTSPNESVRLGGANRSMPAKKSRFCRSSSSPRQRTLFKTVRRRNAVVIEQARPA